MAGPRVLTFNYHEPYLCLLAKTGFDFTVGMFDAPAFRREWQTRFRPLPPNMRLVEERVWREELDQAKYDVLLAQNERNAGDVYRTPVPGVVVCHNRFAFIRTTCEGPQGVQNMDRLLDRLQERFTFVFISPSKRDSYSIPGEVILPGIDVEEFGGYRGETAQVLRVGNAMRARDLMFDVDFQEAACGDLPNCVLGDNPDISGARPSASYEELLEHYRSLRCYLHVSREEYEDGYNLAMLEAMACGMPVVALANQTSPITHGINGYVSADAAELNAYLKSLIADQDLAREIGARGRECVAEAFPMTRFVERWREVLETVADEGTPGRFHGLSHPGKTTATEERVEIPRLRILMEYCASPFTTARYMEWALRRWHEVKTAGFRCPEEILRLWGFDEPIPHYRGQEIELGPDSPYAEMIDKFPESYEPQLFFYVDSARSGVPGDIALLEMPKVCYLIDTHIAPDLRLETAKHFDFVFMAQKGQVEAFRAAGITSARWMPLGCSPELHRVEPRERRYDVTYVGSLADADSRRNHLMERIRERFPNSFIGKSWPSEMAEIYAQSKIVINACVEHDVNMRVFEAMASGAMLITDEAIGLEDLFEDGRHLVVYRKDEDAVALVEQYLADEDARERIARAGQTEVLANHTYERRLEAMLIMVLEALGAYGGISGEARYHFGGYYASPRPELAAQVPKTSRRVLDVGCGGGAFGANLKQQGVGAVYGVEVVERAWERAKTVLDEAILGNLEEIDLPYDDEWFDCIVCGDVLEHLVWPVPVLKKLYRVLDRDGILVASIPNVRYYDVIRMMADYRRWRYEDAGIMDRTHMRFFTAQDMQEMFEEAGFEVLRIAPLSMGQEDDFTRNADGSLTFGRLTIADVSEEEFQDLRVYQYLVVAGRPDADALKGVREALADNCFDAAYAEASRITWGNDAARETLMGIAAARMGTLDLAETHYRKALAVEPDHMEARQELGILLVAMNRLQDARALLSGLEESALLARGHGALGLICLADGDDVGAFGHLERCLLDDVDNESLLKQFVACGERLHRLADVVPLLKKFVDFYPGKVSMGLLLARCLIALGDRDAANEALDTILLLDPSNAEALQLLRDIDDESG